MCSIKKCILSQQGLYFISHRHLSVSERRAQVEWGFD